MPWSWVPAFAGTTTCDFSYLRLGPHRGQFLFPLAEIILTGARARTLGRRIRIEAGGRDGGDAAVLAHLEHLDPAVRAAEHPVLALELGGDALDRALGAEGLAASRAAERLLFLEQARRRARRAEIELRLERDHLLGAGRLAQPSLHAGVLGESESRTRRIVHQRAGRTSGYTGKTERAPFGADLDGAEWRTLRKRDDVHRSRGGAVELAQRKPQQIALLADRLEARGPRCGCADADGAQRLAERERIVGLDRGGALGAKTQSDEDRLGESQRALKSQNIVPWFCAQQEAQCRCAIGECRRDQLEPDLRDFVDRERQHVGGKAVTMARERIDQLAAMVAVMDEDDRIRPSCGPINREQRAQLAQQCVHRWKRIGCGAGRTGRRAAA